MKKQVKFSFLEFMTELERREIILTTDGDKIFMEGPKGTYWNDLWEGALAYKQALIDVAGQRQ